MRKKVKHRRIVVNNQYGLCHKRYDLLGPRHAKNPNCSTQDDWPVYYPILRFGQEKNV